MTRQREWQKAHKQAGLCIYCSLPAATTSGFCLEHHQRHFQYTRNYWRAKKGLPPTDKPVRVRATSLLAEAH